MKRTVFLFLLISNLAAAQVKVKFVITTLPGKAMNTDKIFIAGNFNNWSAGSNDGLFTANANGAIELIKNMAPGNYEYKITRGSWEKVECTASGASIANRELHVAHDTTVNLQIADWQDKHTVANQPTAARKHTASAQVHIINEKFDIPQLGRQRRVWIYLPKSYETSKKKYPVIYMHDGQNLFDEYTTGYGQEWGVDEFLDSLKKGQQQVIIVGVDHGGDQRISEYSPFDSKYGKGRGDDYVKFLVETLKPYIDSHYQTLSDVKHTTVAGSSMGGIISLYAAVKYPKVFGSAGVFSPAFWINPQLLDYAKEHADRSTRFYFVCGDAESDTMVSDMHKMVSMLKAKGLPEKNIPELVIKGAKHNEQQWRSELPAFYDWLMMKK